VDVQDLGGGLWRWTAGDAAPAGVAAASFLLRAGEVLVLVDPAAPAAAPDAERFWRHLDRDVVRSPGPIAVVLTSERHRRSTGAIEARYGLDVPVVVWSPGGRLAAPVADALDGEVVRVAESRRGETALHLPRHRAVVVGDVLVGSSDAGLRLAAHADAAALAPLLELPVDRVLTTHGPPVLADGRRALADALRRPAPGHPRRPDQAPGAPSRR
jgi:hypothetical protein